MMEEPAAATTGKPVKMKTTRRRQEEYWSNYEYSSSPSSSSSTSSQGSSATSSENAFVLEDGTATISLTDVYTTATTATAGLAASIQSQPSVSPQQPRVLVDHAVPRTTKTLLKEQQPQQAKEEGDDGTATTALEMGSTSVSDVPLVLNINKKHSGSGDDDPSCMEALHQAFEDPCCLRGKGWKNPKKKSKDKSKKHKNQSEVLHDENDGLAKELVRLAASEQRLQQELDQIVSLPQSSPHSPSLLAAASFHKSKPKKKNAKSHRQFSSPWKRRRKQRRKQVLEKQSELQQQQLQQDGNIGVGVVSQNSHVLDPPPSTLEKDSPSFWKLFSSKQQEQFWHRRNARASHGSHRQQRTASARSQSPILQRLNWARQQHRSNDDNTVESQHRPPVQTITVIEYYQPDDGTVVFHVDDETDQLQPPPGLMRKYPQPADGKAGVRGDSDEQEPWMFLDSETSSSNDNFVGNRRNASLAAATGQTPRRDQQSWDMEKQIPKRKRNAKEKNDSESSEEIEIIFVEDDGFKKTPVNFTHGDPKGIVFDWIQNDSSVGSLGALGEDENMGSLKGITGSINRQNGDMEAQVPESQVQFTALVDDRHTFREQEVISLVSFENDNGKCCSDRYSLLPYQGAEKLYYYTPPVTPFLVNMTGADSTLDNAITGKMGQKHVSGQVTSYDRPCPPAFELGENSQYTTKGLSAKRNLFDATKKDDRDSSQQFIAQRLDDPKAVDETQKQLANGYIRFHPSLEHHAVRQDDPSGVLAKEIAISPWSLLLGEVPSCAATREQDVQEFWPFVDGPVSQEDLSKLNNIEGRSPVPAKSKRESYKNMNSPSNRGLEIVFPTSAYGENEDSEVISLLSFDDSTSHRDTSRLSRMPSNNDGKNIGHKESQKITSPPGKPANPDFARSQESLPHEQSNRLHVVDAEKEVSDVLKSQIERRMTQYDETPPIMPLLMDIIPCSPANRRQKGEVLDSNSSLNSLSKTKNSFFISRGRHNHVSRTKQQHASDPPGSSATILYSRLRPALKIVRDPTAKDPIGTRLGTEDLASNPAEEYRSKKRSQQFDQRKQESNNPSLMFPGESKKKQDPPRFISSSVMDPTGHTEKEQRKQAEDVSICAESTSKDTHTECNFDFPRPSCEPSQVNVAKQRLEMDFEGRSYESILRHHSISAEMETKHEPKGPNSSSSKSWSSSDGSTSKVASAGTSDEAPFPALLAPKMNEAATTTKNCDFKHDIFQNIQVSREDFQLQKLGNKLPNTPPLGNIDEVLNCNVLSLGRNSQISIPDSRGTGVLSDRCNDQGDLVDCLSPRKSSREELQMYSIAVSRKETNPMASAQDHFSKSSRPEKIKSSSSENRGEANAASNRCHISYPKIEFFGPGSISFSSTSEMLSPKVQLAIAQARLNAVDSGSRSTLTYTIPFSVITPEERFLAPKTNSIWRSKDSLGSMKSGVPSFIKTQRRVTSDNDSRSTLTLTATVEAQSGLLLKSTDLDAKSDAHIGPVVFWESNALDEMPGFQECH